MIGELPSDRVRLTPGALQPPDEGLSRGEARRLFLVEVRRLAPVVLDDLAGEPLARFADAWAAAADGRAPWLGEADWTWELIDDVGRRGHPLLAPLRRDLLAWAGRHRLGEPWLLDRAVSTLALWCEISERAEAGRRDWFGVAPRHGWAGVSLRQPMGEVDQLVGPFHANPLFETRDDARRRAKADHEGGGRAPGRDLPTGGGGRSGSCPDAAGGGSRRLAGPLPGARGELRRHRQGRVPGGRDGGRRGQVRG